ncbi:MAG: chemotaxis protein CheD [Bdellovibrionales bacterium GWA2_49_15]|nr:MAG: chemotaxis protein CheD [Bdellovibrionales bacterium GWA2_49_15]HAZ14617.1 chemotaxis protein CheD [Bdellovibrionales bacterium]
MDRSKNIVVVGISEMAISQDENDILVTYSLGSCVGVVLHDPVTRLTGLVHCMLPSAGQDAEKAREKPCMFVDTGMTELLQGMFKRGAEKKNLICKVAGGGHPMDDKNLFRIGERNYAILRKILMKNNMLIKGELIGGKSAKTVFVSVASGVTTVKLNGQQEHEI